jgi:regulatory protein
MAEPAEPSGDRDDPDADPESVARSIALRMLERQPRTRAELASGMAKRGVPPDVADGVLDRFADVGLIDDAAFAKAWVDSRHGGKGLARRALAAELRRRGVDEDLAADALAGVSTDDEAAAARALVQRRLRSMSGLPPDVTMRRLTSMLARKGFGGSLSYAVVRAALEEDRAFLDDHGVAP